MSVTVDVNVLVYASNADDAVHVRAQTLMMSLAAGPDLLYLFWPVLMGYLRIVTQPGILPSPLTAARAEENVGALIDRPHVRTPGELEGFWPAFRSTTGGRLRGRDVPDAHLVALMRQHGCRTLLTRDRGFRRFEGIEARDPFA